MRHPVDPHIVSLQGFSEAWQASCRLLRSHHHTVAQLVLMDRVKAHADDVR